MTSHAHFLHAGRLGLLAVADALRAGRQQRDSPALDSLLSLNSASGSGAQAPAAAPAKSKKKGADKGAAAAASASAASSGEEKKVERATCDFCGLNLTDEPCMVRCGVCKDFDLCLPCFSVGVEIGQHRSHHPYFVMEQLNDFPVFAEQAPDWSAAQELHVLEGIDMYGFGNWDSIAQHVELKTPIQCAEHIERIFLQGSPYPPLPCFTPADTVVTRSDILTARNFPNRAAQVEADIAAVLAEKDLTVTHADGAGVVGVGTAFGADDARPAAQTNSPMHIDSETADGATRNSADTSAAVLPVGTVSAAECLAELGLLPDSMSEEARRLLDQLQKEPPTLLRPDPRSDALIAPQGRQYEGQAQSTSMSAADWAGWMRLRGDFAQEWEDLTEDDLTNINFGPLEADEADPERAEDRRTKLRMLEIYNHKLNERAFRKRTIVENNLFDYKKFERRRQQEGTADLFEATRVFLRLLGSDRYDRFLSGLRQERVLRERIAHLKEMRSAGLSTLAEVEAYDRAVRQNSDKDMDDTSSLVSAASASSSFTDTQYSSTSRRERSAWRAAAAAAAESEVAMSLSRSSSRLDLAGLSSSGMDDGAGSGIFGESVSGAGFTSGDVAAAHGAPPLDLSNARGFTLLSPDERDLCTKLRLWPQQYLMLKDTLIRACLETGRISIALAAQLVRVDPSTLSLVFDFFTAKGWINRDYSDVGDGESSAMPPIVP